MKKITLIDPYHLNGIEKIISKMRETDKTSIIKDLCNGEVIDVPLKNDLAIALIDLNGDGKTVDGFVEYLFSVPGYAGRSVAWYRMYNSKKEVIGIGNEKHFTLASIKIALEVFGN